MSLLNRIPRTPHPTSHTSQTPHTSLVTPHTSHLTPHVSLLIPHTSRFTPHASQHTLCTSRLRLPNLPPETSDVAPLISHLTPYVSHLSSRSQTSCVPRRTGKFILSGGMATILPDPGMLQERLFVWGTAIHELITVIVFSPAYLHSGSFDCRPTPS